jgi:hypothetical protein
MKDFIIRYSICSFHFQYSSPAPHFKCIYEARFICSLGPCVWSINMYDYLILCLLRVSTSHVVILREVPYGRYITSLRLATEVAETCRRHDMFIVQDNILLYAFISVVTVFTELTECSQFS